MEKPNRPRQAVFVFLGGLIAAFAIVGIGCEGSTPVLGTVCGHSAVVSLVVAAVASWLVLGLLVVLLSGRRANRQDI